MRKRPSSKQIKKVVAYMEKNAIKPDKNGNYTSDIPNGCFIPSMTETAKHHRKKWCDAIYKGLE